MSAGTSAICDQQLTVSNVCIRMHSVTMLLLLGRGG